MGSPQTYIEGNLRSRCVPTHMGTHTHAGRYVGVIQRKVHTCEIMHVLCMNVGMHVCVNVGTHAGTHGYVDTGTD